MKKILFFLMMLVAMIPAALQAQETITIGNGTTTTYYPLPGLWGYQYDVYIYTPDAAEALNENFVVTQIAYNVSSNSSTSGAQMTIWMKDVSSDFALAGSNTFAELISNATEVYSTTGLVSTSGWSAIELSETFTHQGGEAILIAVRGVGCTTSGGCSRSVYYTSATGTHWGKHVDTNDPTPSTTGTIDANRTDIQLTVEPAGDVTCPKPNTLTVSDITTEEAYLTWTDEEATGNYILQYKTASQSWDDADVVTENTSNTEMQLTGLVFNTTYNVRVASVCGSETSSWRSTSFTTPLISAQLPFSCDFEDETTNAYLVIANGSQTNKWVIGSAVNNTPDGESALYISNDNGVTNAYSHTASSVWAYMDVEFPEYAGFLFRFDWKGAGEGNYDYLRVYIGDPVNVAAGSTTVPTGAIQLGHYNLQTSWQTEQLILSDSLSNTTKRLYFYWHNDGSGGSNPPIAVDNILLAGINCNIPDSLRVSNVDMHSADLQWVSNDEMFNVYYKANGDSLFTLADISPVYEPFCTLNDLTEATNYSVKVASVCDDLELFSSTINFNTMCEPTEITETTPWFEDFEGYTHDGAGQERFVCFDTPIQDATYHGPFVYCNYRCSCHSGVNSAELKGSTNMLVLPAFVNDIHTLRLTFWATATSTTVGNLVVGVVTDPNDPDTFEPVGTTGRPGARGASSTTESGWGNFMGPFDFVGVQAENGRIALRYTSTTASASWNLDDFTVSLIPECAAPVANSVTATNVTGHTATIYWVDNDDNHTNWMVYYRPTADSLGEWQTAQVSDTFAILTDLVPETAYQAYVVTVCGTVGTEATQQVTFTTDIACPAPSNLTLSNVTTESATLTWAGDAESYTVEYGPIGFEFGEGNMETVSSPTIDLTLEPSTMYMVYVYGDCGADGTTDTSSIRFTTPCVPIDELPYTEDFNNYTAATGVSPLSSYPNEEIPLCWSYLNRSTTSGSYPQVFISSNTGYPVSGNCLFFRSSNTTPVYAVLPTFSEPIQNLQITFTYRNEGVSDYNGTLSLGYMTDVTNVNSFVQLMSFPQTTTLTEKVVVLNQVPDDVEAANIVFKYTGGSGSNYYVSIDNVIVEEIATCPKPASIEVLSTTANTVTVSWSAAGEDLEYEIAYGAQNFNPDDAEDIVTSISDTSYEIEDLTSGVLYEFYVRSNCGGNGVSGWRGPITAAPGSYNMHVSGWDTLYTCGAVIYDDGGVTGVYSNSCNSYLVVYPDQEGSFVQITGTFLSESPSYDYISFYDGDTVSSDRLILKTAQTSQVLYNIPTITSTTGPITIYFRTDGSGQYAGFELVTSCVNCVAPSITATATSASDVLVTMISPVSSWDLVYGEHGFDLDEDEGTLIEDITDSTFMVDGLTANTTYDFYVRANCDDGESDWSSLFSATTLCASEIAPYSENFAGFNTAVSPCWGRYSGLASEVFNGGALTTITSGWYFSSSNVFPLGHPKVNVYGSSCRYWLVSPNIDISELSTPALIFSLALTDYGNTDPIEDPTAQADDKFMVIISTDGGNTWSAANATVWDNTGSGDYTYNAISNTGDEIVIPLSQYTGQTIRIAFYAESTASGGDNDLHIADVSVDEMPTCPKPTGLSVAAITETSVTLSWTAGGSEETWDIVYGEPGFDMEDGTVLSNVTTNPYEVTGLNSTTAYEFYVRANCGGGEMSYWTNSVTTSTSMEAVDLPYSTDFTNQDWKLNNGSCTNKWKIGVPADSTNAALFITSNGSAPGYENSYSVVTAEKLFNMTAADSINVTFDVYAGGESSYDYLKVFLAPSTVEYEASNASTAPTYAGNSYSENAMNFAAYMSQTDGTQSYTYKLNRTIGRLHIDLNMANPSPNGQAKLVFLWKNDGTVNTYQPGAIIENVTIQEAEDIPVTCNAPTNVTATEVSKNSAIINWEQEGTPDSWTISYKKNSADTWTTVEGLTSHPYTLTNLDPETVYNVNVKAVCGTVVSETSATINFETLPDGVDVYANSTLLYPNPTTGQFRIENSELRIENVEVYDVYGKLLNSVEVNDHSTVIDVTGYASGIYFTRIYTDKGIVVKQIVKK